MLSSLLELLDKVEDRFENKPLLGDSGEQSADVKKTVMETVIGERDESRQNSTPLDQYPYWGCHLSDFASTTIPAFRTSDSLEPVSATEDTCDLQSVEVYEPWETSSGFAASGFPEHIEPLPYVTVLDPTDHPYDIFKQGSLSQMASLEIHEDWGLLDDCSLDFLGE
ncbi:Ff.00g055070.m01.CDS01 [Fusarium sp. VM40]|nr:Ff.00g055070.m01.CDS01 [Fusarium sp. VM40]